MIPSASKRTTRLSAEVAEILGMLADLHLLDDLSQRGTIAGAILADDAHLLGALGLRVGHKGREIHFEADSAISPSACDILFCASPLHALASQPPHGHSRSIRTSSTHHLERVRRERPIQAWAAALSSFTLVVHSSFSIAWFMDMAVKRLGRVNL